MGWVELPPGLHVLEHPAMLGASGVMLFVEFFADKIPGVDSGWDLLQTLARVPAGAFLAAATLSPDGELGAGMLATGAGVALTSHVLKAGARALMNTSPEPISNWTASVTEDVAVVGALALAFAHPWIALVAVVAVSTLFAMLVWWIWRRLFRRAPKPQPG
jgi:Kef-type K+ transport system membrane component KefB